MSTIPTHHRDDAIYVPILGFIMDRSKHTCKRSSKYAQYLPLGLSENSPMHTPRIDHPRMQQYEYAFCYNTSGHTLIHTLLLYAL
jgi:hypothetical protein